MEYTFKALNEVDSITPNLVADYNRLITQLRSKETSVTALDLQEIQKREDSELLVCSFSTEHQLVAIAHGTYVCTPPMYMVYVNVVVVDELFRGSGLGTRIMNELEKRALEKWPRTTKISLTSRPNRGARSFYERLGYKARVPENNNETIVFIKKMDE